MQATKIKLLKFVTGFALGGTERQVVNLVKGIDLSTFELHVGCLNAVGHGVDGIKARGVPLVEYKINSLYKPNTFKQQLRLARYVRDYKIHIVHSYGFYSNVFAIPASRLAGADVVVASIRDMGTMVTQKQKRVEKLICRLADCILVNAEAVRQRLIAEGYPGQRIAVIRNGIDLSRFARQGNSSRLRQELGLPPRAPLVAVVSVLRPLKGIEYFLEAATLVSKHFPETRFIVVGDSVYREGSVVFGNRAYRHELERYAHSLDLDGQVMFTGFRLDVAELLSEVTVSVLPSLSEGLSNTLLESMAAGVPVVATRVGGNGEAVEDGITGQLVPPHDAAALADAVCLLLDNPGLALSFGQAARQRVAEHFSLEQMVRETERLYLRLLEE